MAQSVILWVSSFVITFIVGFIQIRTSSEYPISGTIGVDGFKVSYYLKKIHYGNSDLKINLKVDNENLAGMIKWKLLNGKNIYNLDTMQFISGNLTGSIPAQAPKSKILYNIILKSRSTVVILPKDDPIVLKFLGSVPKSIIINSNLALYLGILLAIRASLEFFNSKPRFRLYSIFAAIAFLSTALVFDPVRKAYELGAIGRFVPAIGNIFEWRLVLLSLLWIITLVLVSFTRRKKYLMLISAILTILIFLSKNI